MIIEKLYREICRFKKNTIQNILFASYSTLIVIVIMSFMIFFYYYTSHILTQRAVDSIQRLSNSISKQLDLEIRKIDTVSLNIVYSNLVRDHFEKYLTEVYNTTSKYKESKTLMDIFIAISGPSLPVQQINLYSFDGKMIGAGFLNSTVTVRLNRLPWVSRVLLLDGRKYISIPYNNAFFVGDADKSRYFISLYRVYFNNFRERMGIVEVVQDYNVIFSGLEDIVKPDSEDITTYVFNDEGHLVYPVTLNPEGYKFYFQNIKWTPETDYSGFLSIENPREKEKEIVAYTHSGYTGWSVILVQPTEKIMLSASQFTRLILFITIILLGFSLVFSFLIAKRFTEPIKKMHYIIKTTNLETLGVENFQELNSNINELEELNQAFYRMSGELKRAVDDLVIAKQREIEAKMLALQSQINPHFLRNCLTNISIMAEEGTTVPIITMCKNISSMLYYISSDSSSLVKIDTEIDYTKRYLEVIKLRYGKNLKYSINIDERIKEIRIPKLLIQPLVENAVKYGTDTEPPWLIEIKGCIIDGYWQIMVRDNGPGFSKEKLNLLEKDIEMIKHIETFPDTKSMGLLNVFARLYLSYRDKAIFKIGNNLNGGATVLIGGSIIEK